MNEYKSLDGLSKLHSIVEKLYRELTSYNDIQYKMIDMFLDIPTGKYKIVIESFKDTSNKEN